jgi:hypothetical protein
MLPDMRRLIKKIEKKLSFLDMVSYRSGSLSSITVSNPGDIK